MPNALVVGHTGQDGYYLTEQLAAKGVDVVGVSRSAIARNGQDRPLPPGADLTSILADIVKEMRPGHIYYLAACHGSSQESGGEDGDLAAASWETHVHQFDSLLKRVRASSPLSRVFYASSSRVFGSSGEGEFNEASPIRPRCVYGLTKAAGMQVARHFRELYSMGVCCGTLFNHESPRRPPQYLSKRVVRGMLDVKAGRREVLALGSLDARADWGYAPDYTLAMQYMLDLPEPEDLVVATGELHSVREFVQRVAERLGLDWTTAVVEEPGLLTRPAQGARGDASRLASLTGWRPSVDFPGLVARLVDAARDSGP